MNSTIVIFLVVGIMIVGLGGFLLFLMNRSIQGFYQKNTVLTDGELRFYKVLLYALKDAYYVFPQVRLANVVKIPDNKFYWQTFNPLGGKCVDFVVCDKQTGATLLVIELDDKSHLRHDRKRRDQFVEMVLQKAHIPLMRLPYQSTYNQENLKRVIQQAI